MRLVPAWMTRGTAAVMGVTSRPVRSVASHRRRAAASDSRCGQPGQAVAVRRTRAGWQNGIRVLSTHPSGTPRLGAVA
jgi:hypothetical protein